MLFISKKIANSHNVHIFDRKNGKNRMIRNGCSSVNSFYPSNVIQIHKNKNNSQACYLEENSLKIFNLEICFVQMNSSSQ